LVKADRGICQDDPNIYGIKPLHTKNSVSCWNVIYSLSQYQIP